MSEPAPPGVLADAADRPEAGLNAEVIGRVLDDFRAWLAAAPAIEGPPEGPGAPAPDLYTLLSQLVALRHEVNLQTRAARAQQEQNAETLDQLGQTVEALRQAQSGAAQARQQASEEVQRPLLKTLIDLYDALARAGREMERAPETILPVLDRLAQPAAAAEQSEPPPSPAPVRSLWARWFGEPGPGTAPSADAAREEAERQRRADARAAGERVRQMLGGLVSGYALSLQRIERALRQHGLEPIPAVGQPFDPEQMEVVEAVSGTGRPPGAVLDEIRRGYLWNGRVFRYAQVRVARS